MTLRRPFRPLRPDLDKFLFATVENETDGIPLSVISVLTRLGLDPWKEADRLSSVSTREAVEQLARLTAELPVGLLPQHDCNPTPALRRQVSPRHREPSHSRPFQFWVLVWVLVAAVLVGVLIHGRFRSALATSKRTKETGICDTQIIGSGMSARLKTEGSSAVISLAAGPFRHDPPLALWKGGQSLGDTIAYVYECPPVLLGVPNRS
jgi:hypothetical protein